MTLRLQLAAAALWLAFLSGCGGGGDDDAAAPDADTPAPMNTSEAVAFQADASHSGVSPAPTPVFPLSPAWQRTFGGGVSYPLIADGKVFVIASSAAFPGLMQLIAIDQSSGLDAWPPAAIGTSFAAGHAYDRGRVFVSGSDGILRAFEASSGALRWSTLLAFSANGALVARDGNVYVSASDALYAVDGASGAIRWRAKSTSALTSVPSLSSTGVLVASYCEVFASLQTSGADRWHVGPDVPCQSGAPSTVVHANGRAYVRDFDFLTARATLVSRDADTGALGSAARLLGLSPIPILAVSADAAYVMNAGTLQRLDPTLQTTSWSFAGDGTLASAPLVIGSAVLIGGFNGKLYALDTATGAERWSTLVPSGIDAPQEGFGTLLTGMAAANGILVVPNGRNLSTWRLGTP